MPTPEDQAREHIDQALEQAGWKILDYKSANPEVGRNRPLMSSIKYRIFLEQMEV